MENIAGSARARAPTFRRRATPGRRRLLLAATRFTFAEHRCRLPPRSRNGLRRRCCPGAMCSLVVRVARRLMTPVTGKFCGPAVKAAQLFLPATHHRRRARPPGNRRRPEPTTEGRRHPLGITNGLRCAAPTATSATPISPAPAGNGTRRISVAAKDDKWQDNEVGPHALNPYFNDLVIHRDHLRLQQSTLHLDLEKGKAT